MGRAQQAPESASCSANGVLKTPQHARGEADLDLPNTASSGAVARATDVEARDDASSGARTLVGSS